MSNKKAKVLLNRALKVIPRAAQTMSKSYLMWVQNDTFPIFADSQDGCLLKSVDGQIFIDTMCGLGPNFLPKKVVERAIKDQLKKGINFSLPTALESELAELLCEVVPGSEMVKFGKNGSDVTSAAIRIARHIKKKDNILMVRGGYNGWSDSFCAVSTRDYGMPKEFKKYIDMFEYNNPNDLELKLQTGKYAAVIIEPVSIDEPKDGFLQKVRDLCTKYDALLIFDEIVTFGRFALGGCAEMFNVIPDITTISKGIACGMPIAAICGKREYMEAFHDVFFSATFFGECLSLAAAIATIKYMRDNKEKIYPYVWKYGNKLKEKFNLKCKELEIDANMVGMAPRLNVKFNHKDDVGVRDLWHQEMIKRGIFIGIQIYMTPMIRPKHFRKIVEAMNESLGVVAKALKEDNIEKYLEGPRSMVIFKRQ